MFYFAEHPWLWKGYCGLLRLAARLWRPFLFRTTFVAVTGSFGKSTATRFLAAMLATRYSTAVSERNQNGPHGVARTLLRVRPWRRFAVLEIGAGMKGGVKKNARLIRPDIAVVTNVKWQHGVTLGGLDGIAAEKAELLNHLRRAGRAVLNADDPRVAAMAVDRDCEATFFGRSEKAAVRCVEARSAWPGRLTLTVEAGGRTVTVPTRMVGGHWTDSLLAALATAELCGVPLEEAAKAIADLEPLTARMQPTELPCGAVVWRDDYNGGVDTLEAGLEALRDAEAQRKIVVIGDILDSDEEPEVRARRVGRMIAPVADVAVLLGEWRQYVAEGLGESAERVETHLFDGPEPAAQFLRRLIRKGDLVLLNAYYWDHLARLYLAQLGTVSCWKQRCERVILCDQCGDLGFQPDKKPQAHA